MPTVINTNSVSGITSITSSSFGAVQFYNSAGISSLGDINVNSVNNGPISGARNRIINGDMRIDQRNAGVSVTVAGLLGDYTLDRWMGFENTDGAATIIRSSTVPVGFSSSLLWTTTTADASLAAGQFGMVLQKIEGYNTSDLAWGTSSAKTVTLSFYVRSSLTGTFDGAITNGVSPADRSYVFNYTISSANTWEQKTVTIPGDISGTWYTDNNTGLVVRFSMGTGTTYQTTANAWTAGNFLGTSSGTSVVGTLNATWYVTGVQLEAGSVATPFERRSYGQELALCQRYFQKVLGTSAGNQSAISSGVIYNTSTAITYHKFATTMRIAPTGSVSSAGNFSLITNGTVYTASTISAYTSSTDSTRVDATSTGMTVGSGVVICANSTTDGISLTSEL